MHREQGAGAGREGDEDGVEAEGRGDGREDARGGDRGDGHRADGDVQDGGDHPHHQQRSGVIGGEVLAEDVAETGRGDGRCEGPADAGEDEDLAALAETAGDRLLDAVLADGEASDEAGADQSDQQRDERLRHERRRPDC